MTTFFDLPIEIRDLIWRKTFFQFARDRVHKKIIQSFVIPHFSQYTRFSITYVKFQLNPTKTMFIESILRPAPEKDTLVVDICDYSRIKVSFTVKDDQVKVYFASVYSIRNFNYRKLTEDQIIIVPPLDVCQWFSSR